MEKKDPTVFVDSYGKIHTERKILAEEGCDINAHGFPVRLISDESTS